MPSPTKLGIFIHTLTVLYIYI